MPATAKIKFEAENTQAKRSIQQIQQSMGSLDDRLNDLRRESLSYRGAVTVLNQELAENRKAFLSADSASKALLQTRNKELQAEKGLIAVRQQSNSVLQANLQQQRRELNQSNTSFRQSAGGAGILNRAVGELTGTLASFGIIEVGFAVANFSKESVNASVKVEGFRNSLTALYGSAQVANRVLADLQELSQLPGITFEGAVRGAVRLKTVDIEGQRALDTIREFGNAAALSGASTEEMTRAIVGLTQNVSRGQIEQDNLNQILENVPLIGNAIRDAFGSIDAEVIRDQLEAAGQSVNDFVDILNDQLSKGARASTESTANAFSNLENATFRLQAAIGDRLTPAVKEATGGLTGLFNTIADFIEGTNDAERSATRYTEALINAGNAAAINKAIQERITFLEQEKTALEEAAAGSANYFKIKGQETGAGREYREITEELNALTTAQNNTASATEHFQSIQQGLIAEAQGLTAEIANLREEIGGRTGKTVQSLNRQLREKQQALEAAQTQIGQNATALKALATANTETTQTTEDATTAINAQAQALQDAARAYAEKVQLAGDVRENLQALSEAQEILNIHWQVASGQLEDYSEAINIVIPSVVNLTEAEKALTAAIDANQKAIADEIGDVEEILAILPKLSTGLTSIAADQAIATAEIKLVNPAISDAADTMRTYIREMDGATVQFQETSDISDRLTTSIREQADAFDALSRSAGRASQDVGSGVFDQFSAQTPGTARGITQANAFDLEGIFSEIGNVGFQFLEAASARQLENSAQIDSVTDSLLVFGDVAARIAAGDLTALGTAVTRTFSIIEQQNAALEERIRVRGIQSHEEHLTRADRFRNFQRVADITGVDADSDDLGEFRQNIASGLTGFTATFSTELEEAFATANLSEGVAQALFQLIADIDRELTSGDIQNVIADFNKPIISGLEELAQQAAFNLKFASQTGGDVEAALQEVIRANTDLIQAQIDTANEQKRATGTSIENVEELNRILNAINNESRLQLADSAIGSKARTQAARSRAEATGTDRQFTEDIARSQYGADAYDAEFAAAKVALANSAEKQTLEIIELQEQSLSFIDNVNGVFTSFEEAATELSKEFTQKAERLSDTELDSLRRQTPDEILFANIARQNEKREEEAFRSSQQALLEENLVSNVNRQIEGLFQDIVGQDLGALFSLSDTSALNLLDIREREVPHIDPDQLVSQITERLPSAIEQLQSGDILGAQGESVLELTSVLESLKETEEQVLVTGFDTLTVSVDALTPALVEPIHVLNESISTIPQELSPLLQAIEAVVQNMNADVVSSVESVVSEIQSLANRPVHVNVNVDAISNSQAASRTSGTSF